MGTIVIEKDILKLVHPGRYVETHEQPLTAADVMKKNPRHWVTRPDIFENPFIVVNPESVLKLGRVYFIVPSRTIYRLRKGKERQNMPVLDQTMFSDMFLGYQGNSPKYKMFNHEELETRAKVCFSRNEFRQQILDEFEFEFVSDDISLEFKNGYLQYEKNKRLVDHGIIDLIINKDLQNVFRERKLGEEVTMLKSCLRKRDSVRNLRRFKVSFVLTIENEDNIDHRKRVMERHRILC